MTYQELKTALKSLQSQGHIIPALNSKKEILEAALLQLQALTSAEVAIEPITETTTSPIEAPETVATIEVANPQTETTAQIITTTENQKPAPSVAPNDLATIPAARLISISPEHPLITEFREVAKFAEWLLVWAVTLFRSFIRFSIPYLARGCQIVLRAAVYGVVIFRMFLLPKLLIALYTLGIWGLEVILRTSRKVSIA